MNELAVDNLGKDALHHLLEASHQLRSENEPPVIRASLVYVANNYGSLVNQPDNAGVYPFIAALSRMRAYWSTLSNPAPLKIQLIIS